MGGGGSGGQCVRTGNPFKMMSTLLECCAPVWASLPISFYHHLPCGIEVVKAVLRSVIMPRGRMCCAILSTQFAVLC